MANLQNNDCSSRLIEAACCKCSKSDVKINRQGAPYLENAVSKIEERRGDLTNRQQHLREKITAMERSIPALMAFNMWTSGPKCDDAPLCKIRQIMNKISPNSDPTEKLVDNLKITVKSLNTETAELHDKIIAADIKLEESEMELESLELANKEFEGILKSLEKEVKKNKTPSLHSIHSEDLFCLTRIRQLGEEEVNLKNSIKELEERETIFQEQMNRILTSREFQKSICNNRFNEKKMHRCPMHNEMKNVQETKKKLMPKGQDLPTSSKEKSHEGKAAPKRPDQTFAGKSVPNNVATFECPTKASLPTRRENVETQGLSKLCVNPLPAVIGCYDESTCPAASKTSPSGKVWSSSKVTLMRNTRTTHGAKNQRSVQLSVCSPKSCCSALTTKSNVTKGQACSSCCKNPSKPFEPPCKSANASTTFQWKCCKGKACCQISPIAKGSAGITCKKCHGLILSPDRLEACKTSKCRCSCKGKCAKGESNVPCNCSEYLENLDDEGYQPLGDSTRYNDQSSTDEEYSECCDCGCNDSDLSDSCQC